MAVAVRSRARGLPRVRVAMPGPFWTAAAACAALAGLSAALLPTVPSYDPWSWIVWGREVFDSHLSFTVAGGPSWKPLPVIFTAAYGLLGGAAPTLWVITARAGGLMALVAAYRLGSRLVRRPRDGAGGWPVVAGLIAAAGVALTQEWAYYMFRGTSEPLLVASALWAVDRHLEGRHGSAFVLGVAAGLIRPEAWPFVLLYAVWLWRRDPRLRPVLVLGLLSLPFFWFVPPWIGTGQPFLAASHAADYNGHLGSDPFVTVVHRGADLQVVPSLVFGLIAVAFGWRRGRDRLVLGLAGAAAAWWVLVVAMTLDGYPGLERFFLPAAGLICVLSGAGVVWVAQLAGSALATRLSNGRAMVLAGAAAAVLVALSAPLTFSRIDTARAAEPIARRAVTRLEELSAAVAAVGGHRAVYPCRSSFAAVNHGVQTALAWKLHVTLERVGTSMRDAGVLFVGPHDSIDGAPARVNPYFNRMELIARAGVWRMYRVYRAGHPMGCVGR